ncbi:hypothetical protein [Streptomyces flavofungini]|uniref:hypothetical protein n=1 Tax=Streptomyces flavofungini TaxID=68200 RepID=UPI0025B14512|nr:hypothetical protein [Streptomyces flavofungini]WJV48354.1 hypothetical protein QUY26_24240 [Streptomyces flavofungini]
MTAGGRSRDEARWAWVPWGVAGAVTALLLAVILRLPWVGDLGVHAATIERVRHDPLHPGDPLVDADVPSPYYSPWTVLLGLLAKATGAGAFGVLRGAALVGLALLLSGVWHFVRTLTDRRAAPPLALLCVLFLWGPALFEWSGFLGLNSLALTVSYPSTFALGLSFHLWGCLREALRAGSGRRVFLGLGALWAVVLLTHQFTGVVASLGAAAMLLGARPWPARPVLVRLAAGLALGLVVLAVWPYYSFFDLLGAGADLEEIHRALYRDLPGRFGLALLGVAALALRFRRDRRDPLVLFFALGAVVFAAGGLSGHYAWGRVLPAALIPAQVAAAVEVAGVLGTALPPRPGAVGDRRRRTFAAALATTLTAALAVGAWTQAGTLGYVLPKDALPSAVAAKYRPPWPGYRWITPWVRYGDVVLAKTFPARQIPAYGAYTVAPGYPDFFLPDEVARKDAVRRYFAPGTPRAERLEVLRRYGVRWVVAYPGDGGLGEGDPALRKVAVGVRGQVLYGVVG